VRGPWSLVRRPGVSQELTTVEQELTTVEPERVAENMNRALHAALTTDPVAWFLGEDVSDPYGGAFKISRGLSTRFPERVISTPISEAGIVGVAGGLALAGDHPIVEIMFADFAALAFDPILNFLSKSVAMYGREVPMHVVVRTPVGGHRGYGPTHSQSPQKHFVGIPHLELYELSPFHDSVALLRHLLGRGVPCMLFENKVLYTERMYVDGRVDGLFSFDLPYSGEGPARVFIEDPGAFDVLIVAPGATVSRVLAAARSLYLRYEINCQVLVPARLFPCDVQSWRPTLAGASRILVVEDGPAGGAWGLEVANCLYPHVWGRLAQPIRSLAADPSVIPAAVHLEDGVLVNPDKICRAVLEMADV
jgi:pyruvate/2-oxoglutarate/acetoin dehydrogenase E1 component